MPTDSTYSLQDLADLGDVSPRTIRYYVAQGLLPSPGQAGPGARYSEGHLARLRLIRRLQREHLPLAEIRARLASLPDDAIAKLAEADAPAPPEGSALDYVRAILDRGAAPGQPATDPTAFVAPASKKILALGVPGLRRPAAKGLAGPGPARLPEGPPQPPAPNRDPYVVGRVALSSEPPPAPTEQGPDRSQWDRLTLSPDIELHIRRPLSRHQNKRVERLIAIARELLEEDPS